MNSRADRRRRTKNKFNSRAKFWYNVRTSKRVGTASHMAEFDDFMEKEKWVKSVKNTAKSCSCQMCRNPRRSYWKYKTRQEEEAAINCREQINEHIDSRG